jgi:hypothetical protein
MRIKNWEDYNDDSIESFEKFHRSKKPREGEESDMERRRGDKKLQKPKKTPRLEKMDYPITD